MDPEIRATLAEYFNIKAEDVTDAHLALARGLSEKIAPVTVAPHLPVPELSNVKFAELKEQMEAQAQKILELERAKAEQKRPEIGSDEYRQAHDDHEKLLGRLGRIKTMPDLQLCMGEDVTGDEDLKAAQKVWDNLYTLSVVRGGVSRPRPVAELKYWHELEVRAPEFSDVLKALATSNTGQGLEWAPDRYSANVIDAIWEIPSVTNLFTRFTQPADTWKSPFGLTGGTAYLSGESTTDDPAEYAATTPTTADVTYQAKKIATRFNYSEEADEDSIVAMLPRLQQRAAEVMAEAIEEAIISGDTSATHMDSNVTSSIDRRKAWDGLRHQAAVTLTTAFKSLATFDGDTIGSILNAMTQKYLTNPANVALIFPSTSRISLLGLVMNSTNNRAVYLRSTDLGDRTVLTGQVGDLFGHPVMLSGYLPTNLNASGVYDGSTTTKKSMIAVARNAWEIGDRRELRIQVVPEPLKGRNCLLATWRGSFTHVAPATDVTTGGGYNF